MRDAQQAEKISDEVLRSCCDPVFRDELMHDSLVASLIECAENRNDHGAGLT